VRFVGGFSVSVCRSQAPSNSPEGGESPSFGGVRGGKTMNNEKPIIHYNIVETHCNASLPYIQQKQNVGENLCVRPITNCPCGAEIPAYAGMTIVQKNGHLEPENIQININ
jgi:hypothetical protein